MPARVAVNIITGPLGVGKTSAISGLLAEKPLDEHWAVLVNEFGAVGVDGALLGAAAEGAGRSDGVTIKEVGGGCMCCAGSAVLTPTVAQLVRRARPKRLLVEPSGLGHPGGLIDALTGPHLGPALELKATICLVDARAVAAGDAALLDADFFQSMVSVADVVVASKADLATEEELEAFLSWGRNLFPPKAVVATNLTAALLDTPTGFQPPPELPDGARDGARDVTRGGARGGALDLQGAFAAGVQSAPELEESLGEPPAPGRPRLQTSARDGRSAAGWAFSASDIFDVERLRSVMAALLATPGVLRVKGIFRLGREWFALRLGAAGAARSDDCIPLDGCGGMTLRSVAYRKDSRIELIIDPEHVEPPVIEGVDGQDENGGLAARARHAAMSGDWQSLESVLLECLRRV